MQTLIGWNDAGHVPTPAPTVVAAARAALVEERKDTVTPEPARADAELVELQQLITKGNRIDRADDASVGVAA